MTRLVKLSRRNYSYTGAPVFSFASWALMLVCCLLTASRGSAQISIPSNGNISTIAGTGTSGCTGSGVAATSATMKLPTGVKVDASGNVYIADQTCATVRKITASTGVITTIAGNGTNGYSGDGSAATSAELDNPSDVAIDSSGNIYIADYSNNRVRKVNTSGVISTYAGTGTWGYSGDGGQATSAKLATPSGVALDSSGNLYIADFENKRIRKVSTSGVITTVAGNGTGGDTGDGAAATSAEINGAEFLAVDGSANIYFADQYDDVVRKVTASTGYISTVAGQKDVPGSSGDGGAATSAELNVPMGVAVDSLGNLLISDQDNYKIRMVNSSGTISTIAGTGTKGYSGDGGAATSAKLSTMYGLGVDASANLYITDAGNYRIRVVGRSSSLPTPTLTLTSSLNPSTYLQSVTFTATISPAVSGSITFYDGSTSLGSGTISSGTATLSTSALTAGSHSITASWPGNGSYGPVTSSPLTQVVNKVTPTLSLTSSVNPSTYGQSVTFTATANISLSGTVTFYNGGTSIGTSSISGTSTTFSTSTLPVGTDSITASWPGDSNTNTVTSSAVSQVVNKVTPTLSLTSSVNPSTYGQSVTFTATANVSLSGTVTFLDGSTQIGTSSISGTSTTFSTSTLAVGSHSITASWPGNTNTNAATSNVVTQVVNKVTPTLSLTSSVNPSTSGQSVTFTATSSISLSGTVTFLDSSTQIGTSSISGTSTTFSTSTLAVGSHSITASWPGDSNTNAATSNVVTQVVNSGGNNYALPNNNSGCPTNCRQIPWLAGSDIWNSGTLPTYTGVSCTGLHNDGATDDGPTIQACITALSTNQCAVLPADQNIYVNSTVRLKSYTCLRGAKAEGAPPYMPTADSSATQIILGASAELTTQNFSNTTISGYNGYDVIATPYTLSGSPLKGATSLTIGTGTVSVGSWIKVFGNDDPTLINTVGTDGTCDWCGDNAPWYVQQQIVQVIAITSGSGGPGSVVTISRPLYYTPYTTSVTVNGETEPAGAKYNILTSGFPTIQAGFENLRVDGSKHDITASNILFLQGCLDCWVRNVETYDTGSDSNSAHVQLNDTYANEIRDSAFHDQRTGASGAGYGVYLQFVNTDTKVENNVFYHNRHWIVYQGGGSGTAVLYNYGDDGMTDDCTYLASARTSHGAHPFFNLFEGNIASHIAADDFWGTTSHDVFFRNWIRGGDLNHTWPSGNITTWGNTQVDNISDCTPTYLFPPVEGFDAVDLYTGQSYYAYVDNVLGNNSSLPTDDDWSAATLSGFNEYASNSNPMVYSYGGKLGSAASSASTIIRQGNYDYLTMGVAYNDGGTGYTYPASMYYTSTPSFIGSCPFPAQGSDLNPVDSLQQPAYQRAMGTTCN
jgi:hypothetical protein